MKPTLAFVDHSFHKKTRSGDFLREIFSKDFEITDYWDESWCGGKNVSVDEINQHDYVFYFQSITPLDRIAQIKAKMVWAPMYDGTPFDYTYWRTLSHYKIKMLSFCKKVDDYARLFGMSSFKTHYYLSPSSNIVRSPNNGKNIYFWYRGSLKIRELLRVIKPEQVSKLVIRISPDPKHTAEPISVSEIEKYNIEVIQDKKFDKSLHERLLRECDVFVAPRKREGIGITTLEAISLGKCVIAWNDATMNEYINRNNGYLFNGKTKTIDLSSSGQRASEMKISSVIGYEKWLNDSKMINEFIINSPNGKYHFMPIHAVMALRSKMKEFYYSPLHTLKKAIGL